MAQTGNKGMERLGLRDARLRRDHFFFNRSLSAVVCFSMLDFWKPFIERPKLRIFLEPLVRNYKSLKA